MNNVAEQINKLKEETEVIREAIKSNNYTVSFANGLSFARYIDFNMKKNLKDKIEKKQKEINSLRRQNPYNRVLAPQITEALIEHLKSIHTQKMTRIITEKGMFSVIADVVVITPTKIHIYEIKSEGDTFERLKNQVSEYKRIASTVTVVAYIDKVSKMPDIENINIWSVDDSLQFKTVRKSDENKVFKHEDFISLWWDRDIDSKLARYKLHTKVDKRLFGRVLFENIYEHKYIRKYTLAYLLNRIVNRFEVVDQNIADFYNNSDEFAIIEDKHFYQNDKRMSLQELFPDILNEEKV